MRMSVEEMQQEINDLEREMILTNDDDRKWNLKCEIDELKDAIMIFSEC